MRIENRSGKEEAEGMRLERREREREGVCMETRGEERRRGDTRLSTGDPSSDLHKRERGEGGEGERGGVCGDTLNKNDHLRKVSEPSWRREGERDRGKGGERGGGGKGTGRKRK